MAKEAKFTQEMQDRLKGIMEEANRRAEVKRKEEAEQYNKREKHTPFTPGDRVWEHVEVRHKLEPKWSGPIKIRSRSPSPIGGQGPTYICERQDGSTCRKNYEQLKKVNAKFEEAMSKPLPKDNPRTSGELDFSALLTLVMDTSRDDVEEVPPYPPANLPVPADRELGPAGGAHPNIPPLPSPGAGAGATHAAEADTDATVAEAENLPTGEVIVQAEEGSAAQEEMPAQEPIQGEVPIHAIRDGHAQPTANRSIDPENCPDHVANVLILPPASSSPQVLDPLVRADTPGGARSEENPPLFATPSFSIVQPHSMAQSSVVERRIPQVIIHPSPAFSDNSPMGEVVSNEPSHLSLPRHISARSTPPLGTHGPSPGQRMSTQEIRRHLAFPFQSEDSPDLSPIDYRDYRPGMEVVRHRSSPAGDQPEVADDDGSNAPAPNLPVSTPKSSRPMPLGGPNGRFLKTRKK